MHRSGPAWVSPSMLSPSVSGAWPDTNNMQTQCVACPPRFAPCGPACQPTNRTQATSCLLKTEDFDPLIQTQSRASMGTHSPRPYALAPRLLVDQESNKGRSQPLRYLRRHCTLAYPRHRPRQAPLEPQKESGALPIVVTRWPGSTDDRSLHVPCVSCSPACPHACRPQ